MSRNIDHQRVLPSASESEGGRVTIKAVNAALAKLGHTARLMKANGYFYFDSGDAAEWLDKTVNTPTLGSRTLEQWIEEFTRLEKINRELLKGTAGPAPEKKARRRHA